MRHAKIVMTNGWSDDNKGDAAIVHGLIELIRKRDPGAEITLLSSFSHRDPSFSRHYRLTSQRYPGIRVLGALLPASSWGGRIGRRLRRVAFLVRGLWLLLVAPHRAKLGLGWSLSSEERETLGALQEADLIIAKGGHLYFSDGSLLGLLGLFINLYPLLIGQRLGRTCLIYGQSIGPVKGRVHGWLLARALKRCAKVVVREQASFELVRHLLPTTMRRHVEVSWDTAFAIQPEPIPAEIERMLPDRFVAVTLRQWHFPYAKDDRVAKVTYQKYLKSMAEMINYCQRVERLRAVIVPQVVGPTKMEDDYRAWDELAQHCESDLVEIRADLTPGQLASIYQRAEALVGTRFHSVILAATVHTPAIAISYHGHKADGIMQMLGMKDFVADIGCLEADRLVGMLQKLLANRDRLRAQLSARQSEILAELNGHFDGLWFAFFGNDGAHRDVRPGNPILAH